MAAPKRFIVAEIGEEVVLTGDEFRHARAVLRLKVGDEVTLLDGSGAEYSAVIAKSERDRFVLNVLHKTVSDKEPKTEAYLLVGALKGDKTELVVQKAVELGVSKIGVFSSRYCAAYMNENKLERLNRVSREAAKQCLRAGVPEVVYFDSLEAALQSAEGAENKLFACEFLERGERGLNGLSGSCVLVVGSEGGFAKEEYEFAKNCGFTGISLGKRILRAETAAISLTAIVMYELGELQ